MAKHFVLNIIVRDLIYPFENCRSNIHAYIVVQAMVYIGPLEKKTDFI